jgi:hypothetical protein
MSFNKSIWRMVMSGLVGICLLTFFALPASAFAAPAGVSGGGCNSDGSIEACISVNSSRQVASDAYLGAPCIQVAIALYEDGHLVAQDQYTCTGNGRYVGPSRPATSGHTWQTGVSIAFYGGGGDQESSPYQYT